MERVFVRVARLQTRSESRDDVLRAVRKPLQEALWQQPISLQTSSASARNQAVGHLRRCKTQSLGQISPLDVELSQWPAASEFGVSHGRRASVLGHPLGGHDNAVHPVPEGHGAEPKVGLAASATTAASSAVTPQGPRCAIRWERQGVGNLLAFALSSAVDGPPPSRFGASKANDHDQVPPSDRVTPRHPLEIQHLAHREHSRRATTLRRGMTCRRARSPRS